MDILYVVGKDSTSNYQDLRYSLRSICKYGKNIDRIFMVGYIPDWISDKVIRISRDNYHLQFKHSRIFEHIDYVAMNTDIGDNHNGDFLVSMDDHYIHKEVDFNKLPILIKTYIGKYKDYLLPDSLDYAYPHNLVSYKNPVQYQQIMVNTFHYCVTHYLNILNAVPHNNMRLNKNALKLMGNIKHDIIYGNIELEGICIAINFYLKYFNSNWRNVLGIKTNDVKEYKTFLEDNKCFASTDDFKIGDPIDIFLNSLFPDYCKYEIEFN